MPAIEFWFDFASPYSYLSVMRIEAEAARRGVLVRWKPFLLGPIFRGDRPGPAPPVPLSARIPSTIPAPAADCQKPTDRLGKLQLPQNGA